ncbi:MAG: transcriptional regulator [Clostridia bacterium]|nr:transcriptional regulator [Clostridia bacterium]
MSNENKNILTEDINKIVHEPARLKILAYLSMVDTCDFVYLMYKTGLSKGNLSSHLSKLETTGYIDIKKEFVEKIPRTLVSITTLGAKALYKYKTHMLKLLNSF